MASTRTNRPTDRKRAARLPLLLVLVSIFGGCAAATTGGAPRLDLLLDPRHPEMNATAPDQFHVRFETTKGDFVVLVERALSPRGADRFYNLVRAGFYDNVHFFRAISGFMVQFGIHGTPAVSSAWQFARIEDDPVRGSNVRGAITFAMAGPNTRTSQLFINLVDNTRLDGMDFAPFGRVIEGMETVDSLYTGYGEGAPRGEGPTQDRILAEGSAYLDAEFPRLDRVVRARIVDR